MKSTKETTNSGKTYMWALTWRIKASPHYLCLREKEKNEIKGKKNNVKGTSREIVENPPNSNSFSKAFRPRGKF